MLMSAVNPPQLKPKPKPYELDEKIDEYNAVGDTIFVSPEGDSYIGVNAFQEELNNNQ